MCRGFGDPVEGGLSAGDFVEDLVGGFGPDEGLGLSFQWETLQSIRVSSSATEVKLVLVKALRLRTENQHSTRLRHDELVGVKCRCQRRRFLWASQSRTGWLLWADRLSKMTSERGLRGGAARPRRPARRAVLGHRVQRVIHDRFHNIVAEHNRAATPRPDAPHRSGSLPGEPATPPTDRLRRGRAPTSDLGVRTTVGGPPQRQQRLGLAHLPSRRGMRTSKPLQRSPLPTRHLQRPSRSHHPTHTTTDHSLSDTSPVYPIGGTLAKCDPFGTSSTSPWTGAAIIVQSPRTKPCIVTRSRTSTRPMPCSLAE